MAAEQDDHYFDLLNYHRGAMESRRALQFQICFGYLVLILLVAKGAVDNVKVFQAFDSLTPFLQVCLVATFLLFSSTILMIESRNRFDRSRYIPLQRYVQYRYLTGGPATPFSEWYCDNPFRENILDLTLGSWTAFVPALFGGLLTVAVSVFLWLAMGQNAPTQTLVLVGVLVVVAAVVDFILWRRELDPLDNVTRPQVQEN